MTKKNYDLSEVIDLQINEYLLIDEEYLLLLYISSTCMTYKFKNNTRGKKLIHRNLRD